MTNLLLQRLKRQYQYKYNPANELLIFHETIHCELTNKRSQIYDCQCHFLFVLHANSKLFGSSLVHSSPTVHGIDRVVVSGRFSSCSSYNTQRLSSLQQKTQARHFEQSLTIVSRVPSNHCPHGNERPSVAERVAKLSLQMLWPTNMSLVTTSPDG